MSAAPLLAVRELSIEFGQAEGWQRVVDGVSFDLARGEVLGMVGESGSGKTVTSRALIRLLPERNCRIAEGRIELEGRDVVSLSAAELGRLRGERVAMIFQNPSSHLDPVMRIGAQIAEGLVLHQGLGERAARKRSIELLAEVGFRDPEHAVDAYPHELSGGMRQRAMIAAALSCEPALLIADEPTTALDVTIQAQIVELLQSLRKQHDLSILFISHDLGLVSTFCDRVVVMERGRIVETATIGKLVTTPDHPYTTKLMRSQPEMNEPGTYFPIDNAIETAPRTTPQTDGAPLLEIEDLRVSFRRRRSLIDMVLRRPARRLQAVDGVSLTVRRGEALGLVGESGSGKSTLARAVVRLVTPDGGVIRLDGQVQDSSRGGALEAWQRRVQMIFQDPLSSLNPRMTVTETLAEPLRVHAICPPSEIAARVAALMREVGLDAALANRRPHQLSGGQCQRVGIARALALEPELILADEPTSALDVTVQAQILNLLMRLRDSRGLTLLFISHDLAVVRHLCQRIAVMQHGKLVEQGEVAQIFEAPTQPYTRRLLAAIPRVADAAATS